VRKFRAEQYCNYRGLGFGIVLHSQFAPEVYLEGRKVG
jgi:hypothetical protein